MVLGARVLGKFGDDPTRCTDAASRRAYAGSAPITRASGKARTVLMRRARNRPPHYNTHVTPSGMLSQAQLRFSVDTVVVSRCR